jgi:hypothetical protein
VLDTLVSFCHDHVPLRMHIHIMYYITELLVELLLTTGFLRPYFYALKVKKAHMHLADR